MLKQSVSALFAALAICSAGAALAGGDHHHDHHKPMYGGIVQPGKEVDFELVVRPELLQLYLSDHGKPRGVAGVSAKVTLLNGKEKQEVALTEAGDRLEAKGTFPISAGTKALA
ncbi:MAG TPA: hypothetical protein VF096_16125, partial [Azonexus sp.]